MQISCSNFRRTYKTWFDVNWGVYPTVAEKPSTTDEMFELAAKQAVDLGFAKKAI